MALSITTALFFVDLDCIVVSCVLRNSAKSGFTNGSGKASAVVELDKEIFEKNARNKIRVHQCLPFVEKILEKPK